jgi:putative PIN family toxin of toxin-antitoxin system
VRTVLDTVVYVRALINPKGRWGRLVFEVAGRHVVVSSPEIIREVIEVLQRPELRDKLPRLEHSVRFEATLAVLKDAEVVEPMESPAICRDRDDDKFFWCAAEASADYLISEDEDILAIAEHLGTRTITASEFLDLDSPE